MIENARFADAEHTLIEATIDGRPSWIPADMDGHVGDQLAAYLAAGHAIAPFAAPVVDLKAYTAERRWQKEVGGVTVSGIRLETDDRSKTMLIGARLSAMVDPAITRQWKTENGFVTLDAPTIIALSDVVTNHVQACFDLEASVLAQIAAGTITTTAQIDTAFA